MENECKPVVDKLMKLLNETLTRATSSSKPMSPDDTVTLIDTSCGYGYEFLKCMQPNLVKECGTNVEKLILDTFDIATDTVIRIVAYLKTILSKNANITVKSSAVKCQKAKNDIELTIGLLKKPGKGQMYF
uniref:Uncharacterized protein n=1 Tax=Romanomermis culicivorax TaxID=13658 RepID=A0A915IUN7_ROMCU